MKIDWDQKFKGIGDEPVTLGNVAMRALNSVSPTQKEPLSLEAHVKRGSLALKIMDGGEQEVGVDDLSLIRQQLPFAGFTPLVVAQAAGMLDPKGE